MKVITDFIKGMVITVFLGLIAFAFAIVLGNMFGGP